MNSNQSRFDIDWDTFQVRKDGQFIDLTSTERALLRELLQHKNQALTHKHLLQKAWGDAYEKESNYLYIYIGKLRKKLEDNPDDPQYLITVPSVGYRWVEAVETTSTLATLSLSSPLQTHLPIPLTSFIGREPEIVFLEQLLLKQDVRLLTLTGPGGIGKTRLALKLAARLRDLQCFNDGIHFVDLVPVDNPDFVISAIAQLFGIREKAGENILAILKRYLQAKQMLVVLDNLEHVIQSSSHLLEILSTVPGIKFLITSREKLHLYGEHNYDVPPLSWSQSDTATSDAVRLFEARAQLVNPHFLLTDENLPIVQQICEQLDGLPLAIELAAVTSKTVAPAALLKRLSSRLNVLVGGQSNLPARHQTLQATIDWSFQRLDTSERQLFIALSVFNGSFTLAAAEAICADETLACSCVGIALAALFNKSLITSQWDRNQDELRYVMLGSFREFANGLIETMHADNLSQRHAAYYIQLLETLSQSPAEQKYSLLTLELGNLRAALRWAIANMDSELALRLCVGMYELWLKLGNLSEGQQSFIEALTIPSDLTTPLRAYALYCAGSLSGWLGDDRVSQGLYRESLRLYEGLADAEGTANVLVTLGSALINQGDFEEGQALSEQALKMTREQNNVLGMALALNNLGMLAIYQGEAEKAQSTYSENLTLWEALLNEQGTAWALTGLSWSNLLQGEYHTAQTLIDKSLALHHRSGDRIGMALALTCDSWIALYQADFAGAGRKLEDCLTLCKELGLITLSIWPMMAMGLVNLYQGNLPQARISLGEALHLCQQLNQPAFTPWVYVALGKLSRCEGNPAAAGEYLERGLSLSLKRDNKSVLAAVLEEFAANFAMQNQTECAVQLYSAAHTLRETYKLPLSKLDHIDYDDLIETLKIYNSVDWDAYWLKGTTLSRDEITRLIIDGLRSSTNSV